MYRFMGDSQTVPLISSMQRPVLTGLGKLQIQNRASSIRKQWIPLLINLIPSALNSITKLKVRHYKLVKESQERGLLFQCLLGIQESHAFYLNFKHISICTFV